MVMVVVYAGGGGGVCGCSMSVLTRRRESKCSFDASAEFVSISSAGLTEPPPYLRPSDPKPQSEGRDQAGTGQGRPGGGDEMNDAVSLQPVV